MQLSPSDRNALVRFDTDISVAPPALGVELLLEQTSFAVDDVRPVTLSGAYSVGGAFSRKHRGFALQGIQLRLTNMDTRASHSLPVLAAVVEFPPPDESDATPVSPYFRQKGTFQLDVRAFFELPSTPARYSVQALADDLRSNVITFKFIAE